MVQSMIPPCGTAAKKRSHRLLRLRVGIPALVIAVGSLLFSTAASAWSADPANETPANKYVSDAGSTRAPPSIKGPETLEFSIPGRIDTDDNPGPYVDDNAALAYALNRADRRIPDGSPPAMLMGVNYLSQWHWYLPDVTTEDILRRDFSRFRDDGITHISLPLYWYRLEGNTRGDFTGSDSYGDAFLANVKRVIEIANEYDIKTMVDIHTLWGSDSTWCTPGYVLDPVSNRRIGLAVVRDATMRQAFLDMFTHTVQYLKGTPGIWAWALNEPWYWPHELARPFDGIDQKENFIALFEKMQQISRTIDGRPFTVRFVTVHTNDNGSLKDIFRDDWGWDERMFASVDFVSFNAYLPQDASMRDKWKGIIGTAVNRARLAGKRVWITEFGSRLPDTEGAAAYQEMLGYFSGLPIDGALAWLWRSDGDDPTPAPPGTGFNICADSAAGTGNEKYTVTIRD
jgi:hypothetical protein